MLQKLKAVIACEIQVNKGLPTLFQLITITTMYKQKGAVKIKHDE